MPDISVLMAVYNGMPYLPEAVESILNQTFTDWECVIVNDGSTDSTPAYLDQLVDPRIRVIHSSNAGLAAALNRGLSECHCEFLARMDSDDVAHATRFEEQLAFLRHRPDVGLVGSQIERLGESRGGGRSLLPCEHASIYEDLMNGLSGLYHSAILCRTALLKEIGGYWKDGVSEDWDMFLRIGERSSLANVDQVLLSYRFDSGSITGANMKAVRDRIEYAVECARRRQSGRRPISLEEFLLRQESRSWWRRARQAADIYARRQYRIAVGDLLGSRRPRGYARLGWAAICSPKLTHRRVTTELRNRWRAWRRGSDSPSPTE